MRNDYNFSIQRLEDFYGDIDEVKEAMNVCKNCGAKHTFTYDSNYEDLYVQEIVICADCDKPTESYIHIIN